jgi:hypothetical protein
MGSASFDTRGAGFGPIGIGLLVAFLLAAGCGVEVTPTGHWEGNGTAREILMQDAVRELTRSATFDFWFAVDEGGDAVGEVEIVYDAELKVENLPQVTVGFMSFNPKVGGKLTDLDPRRVFPLVGVLDSDVLTLRIPVADEDREPLEFTIRADAGVSAGLGGPLGLGVGAGGATARSTVHEIPMTPFTPFTAGAPLVQRARGPFAARFAAESERWAVSWSAHQVAGSRGTVNLTPQLEDALRELREELTGDPPPAPLDSGAGAAPTPTEEPG